MTADRMSVSCRPGILPDAGVAIGAPFRHALAVCNPRVHCCLGPVVITRRNNNGRSKRKGDSFRCIGLIADAAEQTICARGVDAFRDFTMGVMAADTGKSAAGKGPVRYRAVFCVRNIPVLHRNDIVAVSFAGAAPQPSP